MTDQQISDEFDFLIYNDGIGYIQSFINFCLVSFPDNDMGIYKIYNKILSRNSVDYWDNKDLYDSLATDYGFIVHNNTNIQIPTSFRDFFISCISKGIALEYFKKMYLHFIKTVNDDSINAENLSIHIANPTQNGKYVLDHIPCFLKKYTKIEKISITHSDIVHIRPEDIPISVNQLIVYQSSKLESIEFSKTHRVLEIDAHNCVKLNKITCAFVHGKEGNTLDSIAIDLRGCTEIKSGHNFDVTGGSGSFTYMKNLTDKTPTTIKKNYVLVLHIDNEFESFEGFNRVNYDININFGSVMPNIKSFYGIPRPNYNTFYSNDADEPLYKGSHEFISSFPRITNAKDVYQAYIDILKEYPDLLADESLGAAYKLSNPVSLEQFNSYLKKIKSYGVDSKYIGLLSELLLR